MRKEKILYKMVMLIFVIFLINNFTFWGEEDIFLRNLKALGSKDTKVREDAINFFVSHGEKSISTLKKGLSSRDPIIRGFSASTLGLLDDETSINELLLLLNDKEYFVRAMAGQALWCLLPLHIKDKIIRQLEKENNPIVKSELLKVLLRMENENFFYIWKKHYLKDKNSYPYTKNLYFQSFVPTIESIKFLIEEWLQNKNDLLVIRYLKNISEGKDLLKLRYYLNNNIQDIKQVDEILRYLKILLEKEVKESNRISSTYLCLETIGNLGGLEKKSDFIFLLKKLQDKKEKILILVNNLNHTKTLSEEELGFINKQNSISLLSAYNGIIYKRFKDPKYLQVVKKWKEIEDIKERQLIIETLPVYGEEIVLNFMRENFNELKSDNFISYAIETLKKLKNNNAKFEIIINFLIDCNWKTKNQLITNIFHSLNIVAIEWIIEKLKNEKKFDTLDKILTKLIVTDFLYLMSGKNLGRDINKWQKWWKDNKSKINNYVKEYT